MKYMCMHFDGASTLYNFKNKYIALDLVCCVVFVCCIFAREEGRARTGNTFDMLQEQGQTYHVYSLSASCVCARFDRSTISTPQGNKQTTPKNFRELRPHKESTQWPSDPTQIISNLSLRCFFRNSIDDSIE